MMWPTDYKEKNKARALTPAEERETRIVYALRFSVASCSWVSFATVSNVKSCLETQAPTSMLNARLELQSILDDSSFKGLCFKVRRFFLETRKHRTTGESLGKHDNETSSSEENDDAEAEIVKRRTCILLGETLGAAALMDPEGDSHLDVLCMVKTESYLRAAYAAVGLAEASVDDGGYFVTHLVPSQRVPPKEQLKTTDIVIKNEDGQQQLAVKCPNDSEKHPVFGPRMEKSTQGLCALNAKINLVEGALRDDDLSRYHIITKNAPEDYGRLCNLIRAHPQKRISKESECVRSKIVAQNRGLMDRGHSNTKMWTVKGFRTHTVRALYLRCRVCGFKTSVQKNANLPLRLLYMALKKLVPADPSQLCLGPMCTGRRQGLPRKAPLEPHQLIAELEDCGVLVDVPGSANIFPDYNDAMNEVPYHNFLTADVPFYFVAASIEEVYKDQTASPHQYVIERRTRSLTNRVCDSDVFTWSTKMKNEEHVHGYKLSYALLSAKQSRAA